MVHLNLKQVKNKEKFVRKLAARLDKASIEDLALLIEADMSGRPPLPKHIPDSVVEILEIARKLGVNEKPEERKISGQDLIDLGFAPGKHFKEMLDFAYDIQMNGFEKDKILKQVCGRFKK
jgi:tRNA nucleotidyltransferase (CCA-adding enzyme)